jgi:nuclear GTP-binding protein
MRYKIEKKVRDQHKKMDKEARKNPKKRKTLKKDPGIPNLWPFKEKLVKEIEAKKERDMEERQKAKLMRQSIESLAASSQKRGDQFDMEQQMNCDSDRYFDDPAINGNRDNSRKAYYKEFKKVVENSDVVIEVLDVRDPLGCRTPQIEQMVMASNKRVILLLNKIDLVPSSVVEKWIKYFRNEYPTIAFKSSTQNQRGHLGHSSNNKIYGEGLCVGADNLVELLKNYCRNKKIKTKIVVGLIGYPNVGKSSVINSLLRSKVCGVGSTPGFTKSSQEVVLDGNICLLDSPGIVFSKAENAESVLRNCIKLELIEDPISPVSVILSKFNNEQIASFYEIPLFIDVNDFLIQIARKKGRLGKGGIPNVMSAARSILQDWNTGKIPYYTIPPERTEIVSTEITNEWGKEFDIDALTAGDRLLDDIKQSNVKCLMMNSGIASSVDMNAVLPMNDEDEMMEDEDVDDMSEMSEECPEAVPIIEPRNYVRLEEKRTKKKVTFDLPQDIISKEEQDLNPQHGKAMKKILKKMKKRGSKAVDDYDFNEDFGAFQGVMSEDEDMIQY